MIERKSLASLYIKKEDIGIRLDKILLKKFNNLSFIKIQKLIRIGFFKVNKRKVKSNYKVNESDTIQYSSKLINENKSKKDTHSILKKYKRQIADIKKKIIYEDDFLLVINKPHGIPVQGGSNVNFNIEKYEYVLDENVVSKRNIGQLKDQELEKMMLYNNNVIKEININLRAIK